MAGLVHVAFGPTSFLMGFIISEAIGWLSSLEKEGLLMCKKAFGEVSAYANIIKRHFIASWEATLPSGGNSADELVKFKRKGTTEKCLTSQWNGRLRAAHSGAVHRRVRHFCEALCQTNGPGR